MKAKLRLDVLEGRDVPAVTVADPTEAYAWVLINDLRRDPAGFADQLDGLRRGTVASAFGFARTDPVVADLGRLLRYAAYPGHYAEALQRLRSTPALGPLGWDDLLADRADRHTDWMKTHAFEHTNRDNPNKTYVPGFPSAYRGGDPDTWGYSPDPYAWHGEDIGYTYGLMANSKAAYAAGRFGAVGFQQRAAFIDTVSYVLEVNSPDFSHLTQLAAPDAGPDGGATHFNAVGIDLDFFEGPYETVDGFGEATISTHRFGLYRPDGSGGFLAGLTFADLNRNGFFDAGEGVGATLTVTGPVSFTDTIDRLGSFGVYSRFVPNGDYTVTATAADGSVLGSQFIRIANDNGWFSFGAAAAAPVVRTVTLTATGTDGVRPAFSWADVPGAVGYQVRLADKTLAVWDVYPNTRVAGTGWSPPADLVPGRSYRVSVRPVFADGDGTWASADFQVATPKLTSPRKVDSLRPTLSWSPVPGATTYAVYLDDSAGNLNLFPNQRVTGTSWTAPADLVSGRTYSVWLRALNARGQGAWAGPVSVTVNTPTVSAPDTTSTRRPTISWTGIDGTAGFTVVIDDLTAGVNAVIRQTMAGTSWSPSRDLTAGHTYRVRVMAANAFGSGAFSAAKFVRITL